MALPDLLNEQDRKKAEEAAALEAAREQEKAKIIDGVPPPKFAVPTDEQLKKPTEPTYVTKSAQQAQEHLNAGWEGTPININSVFEMLTPGQANWAYMDGKMILVNAKTNKTYDASQVQKSIKDHSELLRSEAGDVVADKFLQWTSEGLSPKPPVKITAKSAIPAAIKTFQDEGVISKNYDKDSIEVIDGNASTASVEVAVTGAAHLLEKGTPLSTVISTAIAKVADSPDFKQAPVRAKLFLLDKLATDIDAKNAEVDQKITQQIGQTYETVTRGTDSEIASAAQQSMPASFIPLSPEDAQKALEDASKASKGVVAAEAKITQAKLAQKTLQSQLIQIDKDPRRWQEPDKIEAAFKTRQDTLQNEITTGSRPIKEVKVDLAKLEAEMAEFEKNRAYYGQSNPARQALIDGIQSQLAAADGLIKTSTIEVDDFKRQADTYSGWAKRGQPVVLQDEMDRQQGSILAVASDHTVALDVLKNADDAKLSVMTMDDPSLFNHVASLVLKDWRDKNTDPKRKGFNSAVYNEYMGRLRDGKALPDSIQQTITGKVKEVRDLAQNQYRTAVVKQYGDYEKAQDTSILTVYKDALMQKDDSGMDKVKKAIEAVRPVNPELANKWDTLLKTDPVSFSSVISNPKASRSMKTAALGELEKESAKVAATVADSLKFVRTGVRAEGKAGVIKTADEAITTVINSGLKNEHKAALIGLIAKNNEISGVTRGEFVDGYGFDRLYEMHTAASKATGAYGNWADFMDMYAALDRKLGGVAKGVTDTQKKEIVNSFIKEATDPLMNRMRAAAVSNLATGR